MLVLLWQQNIEMWSELVYHPHYCSDYILKMVVEFINKSGSTN